MAHFFGYSDKKHRIYAFEIKNELEEVVGYRPHVERYPPEGGLSEVVSDKLNDLRWKCFTTEKLAREYAIKYFSEIESESVFERGYLGKRISIELIKSQCLSMIDFKV